MQYASTYTGEVPELALLEGATSTTVVLSAGPYPPLNPVYRITFSANSGWVMATVAAPEEDVRALARSAQEIFSRYVSEQLTQIARPFKVFIAYGGGPAWEVVRDYLRRAEIDVDAFTEAERVGEVTIDVVSQMVHSASVAVIVMTAADELRDGSWHARQNVVHEAGFAQAAIGVRNTIILLEEGVTLPSNLANVTYIPFPRGAVHTTERRVVARVLETKADVETNGGYSHGGGC